MNYSKEYYLKNKNRIIANRKYREKLNPEKTKAQSIIFNITFEYLLQAWNSYKEKHGYKCRYTGETMTFIRGKGVITYTNLSLDRLENDKGYIEGNIIFCTAGFNSKKGSLSIEDCKNIIKVHKDEME